MDATRVTFAEARDRILANPDLRQDYEILDDRGRYLLVRFTMDTLNGVGGEREARTRGYEAEYAGLAPVGV